MWFLPLAKCYLYMPCIKGKLPAFKSSGFGQYKKHRPDFAPVGA
jgi:hypothetical protein